jgi:delta-aminolevulinic acid dehydratase/porphobilinogen synthase
LIGATQYHSLQTASPTITPKPVKKDWSPFNTKTITSVEKCAKSSHAHQFDSPHERSITFETLNLKNDVAVVDNSIIRNTTHGHIGIWHAAAKINRDIVMEHAGLEG